MIQIDHLTSLSATTTLKYKIMWWKVYFYILLILSVLVVVFVYGELSRWGIRGWLDHLLGVLTLLGLYSYAFKRAVLSNKFWQAFFLISIIEYTFYLIYFFTPLQEGIQLPSFLQYNSELDLKGQDWLFGLIIYLPALYSIYQLGFNKNALIETKREVASSHDRPAGRRKVITALLLSIFVGWLGIDRFYMGLIPTGILKLLTAGGLGIWWLIDLILIATNNLKDGDGKYLQPE